MDFKFVLIIIILILFLYFVLNYIYSSTTVTTSIASGTTMQTIQASTLSTIKSGIKSSNFTYSIWFYIDDWNYNYGKEKVLFGRVGALTSTQGANGSYGKEPCPMVTFGGIENNLNGEAISSIAASLQQAKNLANEADVILVTGSFFNLEEAYHLI